MNATTLAPARKTAKAAGPSVEVTASPVENKAFTPSGISKAFSDLSAVLHEAYRTDEVHSYSGDSDRLLRVASDLATTASVSPPNAEDTEHLAFDVAALIVASRRVPGDSASAERQALIAKAKAILMGLTEGSDVLQEQPAAPIFRDGGAKLEQSVQSVAAALKAIVQQAKDSYDGARESEEVSIYAHTLVDIALEELGRLSGGQSSDESESIHRIAACLAGARTQDLADAPSCAARHAALLQAYEVADSAAISFGFVEEPCEALAKGISLGQAMAARQTALAHAVKMDDEEEDSEAARTRIAFDANYAVGELAKALKAHYMRESQDDWPVYDSILGRIQQLSEVVFCAMRLGGTDESMTYPSDETLQRFLDGHLTLILKDR
ncbi:MAG: hypothetical protein Q7T70_02775 [Polaromonas sp.]|nr:hypothetical protein [Polaromonas sp.]